MESPSGGEASIDFVFPVWFIYSDFLINLLGTVFVGFLAYRVLKIGFNFTPSKGVLAFLIITLPIAVAHLIAYYIDVVPYV